jgi:hypothetical protein
MVIWLLRGGPKSPTAFLSNETDTSQDNSIAGPIFPADPLESDPKDFTKKVTV